MAHWWDEDFAGFRSDLAAVPGASERSYGLYMNHTGHDRVLDHMATRGWKSAVISDAPSSLPHGNLQADLWVGFERRDGSGRPWAGFTFVTSGLPYEGRFLAPFVTVATPERGALAQTRVYLFAPPWAAALWAAQPFSVAFFLRVREMQREDVLALHGVSQVGTHEDVLAVFRRLCQDETLARFPPEVA